MLHKQSHRHKRHHTNTFFQEFRFEITIAVLFSLGVFLLVEKLEIKAYLFRWIKWTILTSANFIAGLANKVVDIIHEVETSDIVGIILILIALSMIYYRFRIKMIQRYSTLYVCPGCDGDLHRIHRKIIHRIVGILLWADVKHFSCKKCSFEGVRLSGRS